MPAYTSTDALPITCVIFWKSTTVTSTVRSAASALSVVGVPRHDQSASPSSFHVPSGLAELPWVAAVGSTNPVLVGPNGAASGVLLFVEPLQAARAIERTPAPRT